mmetsp:Transcript_17759/g.57489  ORF Transcript_17759/g.57489 Transcript_17759/m.57489 type:complete len:277 (-) Transcript_17759:1504-2334(-)
MLPRGTLRVSGTRDDALHQFRLVPPPTRRPPLRHWLLPRPENRSQVKTRRRLRRLDGLRTRLDLFLRLRLPRPTQTLPRRHRLATHDDRGVLFPVHNVDDDEPAGSGAALRSAVVPKGRLFAARDVARDRDEPLLCGERRDLRRLAVLRSRGDDDGDDVAVREATASPRPRRRARRQVRRVRLHFSRVPLRRGLAEALHGGPRPRDSYWISHLLPFPRLVDARPGDHRPHGRRRSVLLTSGGQPQRHPRPPGRPLRRRRHQGRKPPRLNIHSSWDC